MPIPLVRGGVIKVLIYTFLTFLHESLGGTVLQWRGHCNSTAVPLSWECGVSESLLMTTGSKFGQVKEWLIVAATQNCPFHVDLSCK